MILPAWRVLHRAIPTHDGQARSPVSSSVGRDPTDVPRADRLHDEVFEGSGRVDEVALRVGDAEATEAVDRLL